MRQRGLRDYLDTIPHRSNRLSDGCSGYFHAFDLGGFMTGLRQVLKIALFMDQTSLP